MLAHFISIFLLLTVLSLLDSNAYAVEADPEIAKLLNELELRESPKPIKESPGWKKPQKVVVFLPKARVPARKDYQAWQQ